MVPGTNRPVKKLRLEEKQRKCPDVNEDSAVVQQFRLYQEELDEKHDKYERIVKCSRDITIDSKRTIFLLQRIIRNEDKTKIFEDAETKLKDIQEKKWKQVALELTSEDPYQFLRAYSPGLQEYIEALSFFHYLKFKTLISLSSVEDTLRFNVAAAESKKDQTDVPDLDNSSGDTNDSGRKKRSDATSDSPSVEGVHHSDSQPNNQVYSSDECRKHTSDCVVQAEHAGVHVPLVEQISSCVSPVVSVDESSKASEPTGHSTPDLCVTTPTASSPCTAHVCVHVPPMEYILGIADLTGELMRMAIGSVGSGDLELPFEYCNFLRLIHDGFVAFGNVNKELPRKLHVLRQSLQKVENTCYTLRVRGSEMPNHLLADVLAASNTSQRTEFLEEERSVYN